MKKFKIDFGLMSGILFVVLGFLYFILAMKINFHYDEAYSIGMISNSYGKILEITSRDVHSPLYYWLLKAFCEISRENIFVLAKVFSWVFMMAFLGLGRYICRKRYDSKVEFYWLLCAGFMPSMMIQATTARMYTMAMFFVTLALYLAYELYCGESKGLWVGFTVVSVIVVYIHTFCMLEMVVVYLFLIIGAVKSKKIPFLKRIFISGIVVSICYIPWLLVLIHQFLRWAGVEKGWSNTIEPISYKSFVLYWAEWFSSLEQPWLPAMVFGVILMVVAGMFNLRYLKRQKDYVPLCSVIIIGIILLLATAVSIFIVPCFVGRYVFPLFGGLWLFVAVGICEIKKKWIRVAICLLILVTGGQTYIEEVKLENPNGLNAYMDFMEEYREDTEGKMIMADTYFAMMLSIYMPEEEYMIWGYEPECLPFRNCTAFTDWEQLAGMDEVWYISLKDLRAGNLSEHFAMEKSIEFSYSYYDLVIEKYIRK